MSEVKFEEFDGHKHFDPNKLTKEEYKAIIQKGKDAIKRCKKNAVSSKKLAANLKDK
ncbi:MAG: hypothetical protein ACI4Q4_00865 [Oscillospiraceae bacterium]